MENELNWIKKFAGAVTICDTEGTILYMNERSVEIFAEEGGETLVGTNVLDCHPEPARSRLEEMLRTEGEHMYTVEKNAKKKFIYQGPWYTGGGSNQVSNRIYAGIVEISFDLPLILEHIVRNPQPPHLP